MCKYVLGQGKINYLLHFAPVSSITDDMATVNISPGFAGGEQESIVVESVISNVEIFCIKKVDRFLKCV